MGVVGFAHFNLRAPRQLLDELRDFYCSVVGLKEGARPPFAFHGYWLYAGDDDVLHLAEASPGETRLTGVATTFHHVAFRCANLAEMEPRLREHKVVFTSKRVPLTGIQQIFFSDPAGNGVELNFAEPKS